MLDNNHFKWSYSVLLTLCRATILCGNLDCSRDLALIQELCCLCVGWMINALRPFLRTYLNRPLTGDAGGAGAKTEQRQSFRVQQELLRWMKMRWQERTHIHSQWEMEWRRMRMRDFLSARRARVALCDREHIVESIVVCLRNDPHDHTSECERRHSTSSTM